MRENEKESGEEREHAGSSRLAPLAPDLCPRPALLVPFPSLDLPSPEILGSGISVSFGKKTPLLQPGLALPYSHPSPSCHPGHRSVALERFPESSFSNLQQQPPGWWTERALVVPLSAVRCPSLSTGRVCFTSILTSWDCRSYFYVGRCLNKNTHNPPKEQTFPGRFPGQYSLNPYLERKKTKQNKTKHPFKASVNGRDLASTPLRTILF